MIVDGRESIDKLVSIFCAATSISISRFKKLLLLPHVVKARRNLEVELRIVFVY